IREIPKRAVSELDKISAEAVRTIEAAWGPRAQGFQLAQFLRRKIGNETGPIQPSTLLTQWNVALVNLETDPSLDAICCWGHKHGPAVLTNGRGRHARMIEGRHSTLAHEIAHLLVDRSDALPFAEVLGGRVPREIEQRANAFAAEFLMPELVVKQEF